MNSDEIALVLLACVMFLIGMGIGYCGASTRLNDSVCKAMYNSTDNYLNCKNNDIYTNIKVIERKNHDRTSNN